MKIAILSDYSIKEYLEYGQENFGVHLEAFMMHLKLIQELMKLGGIQTLVQTHLLDLMN